MMRLPRQGMGTAPLGNLYAEVREIDARMTVSAAWSRGIRYFDTAPHYGFGLAEKRLGDALRILDPRQRAVISTKVGRTLVPCRPREAERHGFVNAAPYEPRFDYSRDAILRSHEESLKRLRRDRVQILLAHDLGAMTHGADAGTHLHRFLDSGYPAMAELKAQGAIDAIGIGVNETAICEQLLRSIDLDIILLAGRYTLLDQSAAERVLPLCLEHGVQLVVGGVYNSGILACPTREQTRPHYDYASPPPALLARAAAIERICERFGVGLPVAALQFPGRHEGVSCVLSGLASPAEAEEQTARSSQLVPEALWAALDDAGLVRVPGAPAQRLSA